MDNKEKAKPMGQVIQIDEARIRDHLGDGARYRRGHAERDAGRGGRPIMRSR